MTVSHLNCCPVFGVHFSTSFIWVKSIAGLGDCSVVKAGRCWYFCSGELGGLLALSFEAILKVIGQFSVLCDEGHDKTCAHLHQVHDVVIGHLRCHDGPDLCSFATGGVWIYWRRAIRVGGLNNQALNRKSPLGLQPQRRSALAAKHPQPAKEKRHQNLQLTLTYPQPLEQGFKLQLVGSTSDEKRGSTLDGNQQLSRVGARRSGACLCTHQCTESEYGQASRNRTGTLPALQLGESAATFVTQ